MSFDYEILDLGLVYYKNAIENPQKLIELIEETDKRFLSNEHQGSKTLVEAWSPWEYNGQIFNMQKFFPEVSFIPDTDYYSKEMKEVSHAIYTAINDCLFHYSHSIYPFAAENIKSREHNVHLLRYDQSGYLPAHQDQGNSSRVLSSVLYLNDNYDGGEIEFRQSGVKLKPEAGSVIFFPSNFLYVHEVHAITKGSRYAMPHWYHNMENKILSDGRE